MAEYYTKLWNMESCTFAFGNLILSITNNSGKINSEIHYHNKIITSNTIIITNHINKLGILIDGTVFCFALNDIPFIITKFNEKVNIGYDFVKNDCPSSLTDIIYLLNPDSISTPLISFGNNVNSWIVYIINPVNNLPKDFVKITSKSYLCSDLLSLKDYIKYNDNISSVIPNVQLRFG